ncbi:methionine--tRNA ligase [Candidatus Woesebacteria bacterium RIFOXYA1_FULL_43_9]|uniref:Methionine--tRNA ligase n=1 Tax=Candidatus Woesebacteria bacterium RIFOXYA1_FULL_43_9 TaxID=1802534 RepID=A0A1F8CPH9_9BACT|nr:MAG: methionine--tRNA ligase [Candidatus Woesebacteria bacterium RIFOXYA1_FULL_43_9]
MGGVDNYYITTTLPYVNADPHIGFALELVQTDCLARYHTLTEDKVIFNTGTDEHGLKIYQKALEQKKDPQAYCYEYAKKFEILKEALNLSYTHFIRTTDPHHVKAAQAFWGLCAKNGDIYKKNYQQKYCVGCELEKSDSELVDGECPLHPGKKLEVINEENYFFKFSRYQKPLLDLYQKNPNFVIPRERFGEIVTFVEGGLKDFSVSRQKTKMPWGVSVPNDPDHVMYVWFDALINYISTLGWPEDENNFKTFWPGVQVAGKDNLRQQTAMWQAMLMSAGLPTSKQIFIHSFITSDGQKMSKSLGNVVDPLALVDKYGTEAVRYFLLAKMNPYEDSDFTVKRFEEAYNADLANGLGNLVSRVAKMATGLEFKPGRLDKEKIYQEEWGKALSDFRFDLALQQIWLDIVAVDKHINQNTPWLVKDQDKLYRILEEEIEEIRKIAIRLAPFLPETAGKIEGIFTAEKIVATTPLFPRI